MAIITNPVFASVVIMLVLCVLHVNVYLAIIIAAVICGLMGGAPLTEIISLFASGISSHGENAIIFIILAAIASAIVASGMSDAMAPAFQKSLVSVHGFCWSALSLLPLCVKQLSHSAQRSSSSSFLPC